MKEFVHFPVMLKEAVGALNVAPGKIYVDATFGGGGYSLEILKKLNGHGMLFAFDVDDDAVNVAKEKFGDYENFKIFKASHVFASDILKNEGIEKIDGGIVYDFGASFHQLTTGERGFSFGQNAPLDMRFDRASDFSAYDVINSYPEEKLVEIFSTYGEERFSKRIAKAIIEQRRKNPVRTTGELVDVILNSTPKIKSKLHPATRVFQAVRIEVNSELDNIKNTLENILPFLKENAIISAVTFHSAEDRIVKNCFRDKSVKFGSGELDVLTKKPILPSEEEIKINPPSRSAKLRYAKKI